MEGATGDLDDVHEDEDWPPFLKMWRETPNSLRSLDYQEYIIYTRTREADQRSAPLGTGRPRHW